MCPKCKMQIQEVDQNWCERCGEDLRDIQTRCGICGHGRHIYMLPGEPKYCTMCGAEWKHVIPPKAVWRVCEVAA